MRSSASSGTSNSADADAPDLAQRQVPARLLRGAHAVDRPEVVARLGRQVGRVALDQVHEPELRPVAVVGEPVAGAPPRPSAAPSSLRARSASSAQRARGLQPRRDHLPGAVRRDVANSSKPVAKPLAFDDPEVRADAARAVAGAAQHLGQDAVGVRLERPACSRSAISPGARLRPGRARQQAGEHRRVRRHRPARRRVDVRQRRAASRRAAASAGVVPGRRAVGLERVRAGRVEHDQQDVRAAMRRRIS